METQQVDIVIEYSDVSGRCPECGAVCPKHDDRKELTWRYLDTMQFSTYLHCQLPRIRCETHGAKTVKAPRAGKNSRFTLLFESFAIRVLTTARSVEEARKSPSFSSLSALRFFRSTNSAAVSAKAFSFRWSSRSNALMRILSFFSSLDPADGAPPQTADPVYRRPSIPLPALGIAPFDGSIHLAQIRLKPRFRSPWLALIQLTCDYLFFHFQAQRCSVPQRLG